MAGSLIEAVYTNDDEEQYAVKIDEDRARLVALGFSIYTGTPILDRPPQGFKMRYVNAVKTTGDGAGYERIAVPCGSSEQSSVYSGTATTFVLNGHTYAVTSTRGEKKRVPTAFNTGLQGASPTVGVGTAAAATGG